ncbi:MAG: porin [Pseudomonadota bacterium]
MKKVLFASTALVAFTGAAVADVELSGRAEMGIFDQGIDGRSVEFFTDIDATFTMTGETDGGLEFGASVDLDESGSGVGFDAGLDGVVGTADDIFSTNGAMGDNTNDGGATIFIKGSFGTVTMGDTDGALDWALTEAGNVGNPGSIADDETSHAGYVGSYLDGTADGQILRWDYTAGDFGVAISVDDDNGTGDVGYAIGLKYNIDLGGTTIALGLGHQEAGVLAAGATGENASATGVSATATLASGLSVGVVYADWDDGNNLADGGPDSNIGVGIGYTTGAFSVHANYGEIELDDNTDVAGFGLAAAYDLGGGAVVHFGYRSDDTDAATDVDTFSLGLGLSF